MFTGVAGSTSAAPGQVIKSATWDSINTDIATALTACGQATYSNAPRVASAGSFTVAVADNTIYVTASAPTITVPLSSTKLGPVRIMGAAAGIFGTNNSVIARTGSDTFSGLTGLTLATNYQILTLYPLASGGYIVGT